MNIQLRFWQDQAAFLTVKGQVWLQIDGLDESLDLKYTEVRGVKTERARAKTLMQILNGAK